MVASRWADHGLEAAWLTAAVLVPLLVLSESSFITFTDLPKVAALRILASLAAALLLFQLAMWLFRPQDRVAVERPPASGNRVKAWLRADPARLLIVAGVALGCVVAVSTALSISVPVSFWGKEPGRDGYGLYTTAAYLALFIAIALRLKSPAQVWRLWGAIALAGFGAALIGIAQQWGLAPFGVAGTAGNRVTGPSGNPIFLGALFAGTAPIAAAGALAFVMRYSWRPWLGVALFMGTYLFLLAQAFTISRGPWAGMAAGGLVFLALVWLTAGRRAALLFALAAVAALIAVATTVWVSKPAATGLTSPGNAAQDLAVGGLESGLQPQVDVTSLVASRFGSGQLAESAELRLENWRGAVELSLARPPVPLSSDKPWAVGALFGYGPDTYRYVYPLSEPSPENIRSSLTDAAHNEYLNRLVETGLAGLLAYLALGAVIAGVGVWVVVRARRTAAAPAAALAVGVLAALAGRAVEQGSGVPQVSDTLVLWIGAGLLASLPVAYGLARHQSRPAATEEPRDRPRWIQAARILGAGGAVAIAAGVVVLGTSRNVDYLRANALAAEGLALSKTDPARALERFERAAAMAPDVQLYEALLAAHWRAVAAALKDPAERGGPLALAYQHDLKALDINLLDRDSNFTAAYGAWLLANGYEPERALDTIELYERLDKLAPSHPLVRPRLEKLYQQVQVVPVSP